jgi:hypothetical protein
MIFPSFSSSDLSKKFVQINRFAAWAVQGRIHVMQHDMDAPHESILFSPTDVFKSVVKSKTSSTQEKNVRSRWYI